jgi:hypothetical protein
MSRILDAKNFKWTPSWRTDITATMKKHGFKRTAPAQRSRPQAPMKVTYLPVRKRAVG